MKVELNGEIIEEFFGFEDEGVFGENKERQNEKAKGEKKNVVKKNISDEDYVDCLFEKRKFMHIMQSIGSLKHQIYTIKQNKVSFSLYNDKRYLLDDGVSSMPYGHFSLLYILRNLSIIFNYFFRNLCNIF